MYSAEKLELDEDTTRKLPEPQGYKLLIAIPKLEEKTLFILVGHKTS